MALDGTTLVILGVGYSYTGPPGTRRPTTTAAPWLDNGHTFDDGVRCQNSYVVMGWHLEDLVKLPGDTR